MMLPLYFEVVKRDTYEFVKCKVLIAHCDLTTPREFGLSDLIDRVDAEDGLLLRPDIDVIHEEHTFDAPEQAMRFIRDFWVKKVEDMELSGISEV